MVHNGVGRKTATVNAAVAAIRAYSQLQARGVGQPQYAKQPRLTPHAGWRQNFPLLPGKYFFLCSIEWRFILKVECIIASDNALCLDETANHLERLQGPHQRQRGNPCLVTADVRATGGSNGILMKMKGFSMSLRLRKRQHLLESDV